MTRTGDVQLQLGTTEVARARGQVRSFCRDLPTEVGDRAERLAADLVGNALQQGRGPVKLTLSAQEGSLTVEIAVEPAPAPLDATTAAPGPPPSLGLVESYRISWGAAAAAPVPPVPGRRRIDRSAAAAWLLVAVVTVGWALVLGYLGAMAYRAAVSS